MMTKKRQATAELVTAFIKNKQEPCDDNLEALFEILDGIEAKEQLLPVLEIAFEAISKVADATGETNNTVIESMRRVPALSDSTPALN